MAPALGNVSFWRYDDVMRKAFVIAAVIALSLGLGACSKCDAYRYWTGPKTCAGS